MSNTETRRRVIHVSSDTPRRGKLWAYGYDDLAEFLGVTPGTVRNWCYRGRLDPADLAAIAALREERVAAGDLDPLPPVDMTSDDL